MGWDIKNDGFGVVLSSDLPKQVLHLLLLGLKEPRGNDMEGHLNNGPDHCAEESA